MLDPVPRSVAKASSSLLTNTPASEEEKRAYFMARLLDEPSAVFTSHTHVARPDPNRDHVIAPTSAHAADLSGQSLRQGQPQTVLWLWEPDESGNGAPWKQYDHGLCFKIEQHFQKWLMATSKTCKTCLSRRQAISESSGVFFHEFRPGIKWRFSFSIDRAGRPKFIQV
jgi:hypothetical protein